MLFSRLTFFVLEAATAEIDDLDGTFGGMTEKYVLCNVSHYRENYAM